MSGENIRSYARAGRLRILVKPGASCNEVLGWDEARGALRVSIASPAEKNKANIEVVRFFSKLLGSKVRMVSGFSSKLKVLKIDGKADG